MLVIHCILFSLNIDENRTSVEGQFGWIKYFYIHMPWMKINIFWTSVKKIMNESMNVEGGVTVWVGVCKLLIILY